VLDEFGDAASEAEFGRLFAALVVERDLQAFVEESVFAETCSQRVVAEGGLSKMLGSGWNLTFVPVFAGFACLLEFIGRLPFFVTLLPNGAIACISSSRKSERALTTETPTP